MTIKDLKKAKDQRPFRPFFIHTADGREFEVRHPDAVAWGAEDFMTVAYMSPTGDWEMIDISLATSIKIPAPAQPRREGNGD